MSNPAQTTIGGCELKIGVELQAANEGISAEKVLP
ncbi:MAG: hypothetical protein ACJAV5_002055 [Vicingaceae bacterium]|jgi:hypothetical protein